MKLYLAGPLFSDAERAFNLTVASRCEEIGYEVFLPQRDGVDVGADDFARLSPAERAQAIFGTDRSEVYGCDVFVFCLDGRVPDEGACVELGLAYAHRELALRDRMIVGLRTDQRVAFPASAVNAMLAGALDVVFSEPEALFDHLSQYAASTQ